MALDIVAPNSVRFLKCLVKQLECLAPVRQERVLLNLEIRVAKMVEAHHSLLQFSSGLSMLRLWLSVNDELTASAPRSQMHAGPERTAVVVVAKPKQIGVCHLLSSLCARVSKARQEPWEIRNTGDGTDMQQVDRKQAAKASADTLNIECACSNVSTRAVSCPLLLILVYRRWTPPPTEGMSDSGVGPGLVLQE